MYLLAIILPPVAVLLTGKPILALLNLLLTICFWLPGVIHAILVVNAWMNDKRTGRIVKAIQKSQKG